MITAYLLIASFLMGWCFATDSMRDIKWSAWERVGTAALCLAWPYMGFLCWKVWRKEK